MIVNTNIQSFTQQLIPMSDSRGTLDEIPLEQGLLMSIREILLRNRAIPPEARGLQGATGPGSVHIGFS